MKSDELLSALLEPDRFPSAAEQWGPQFRSLDSHEFRQLMEGVASARDKLTDARTEAQLERALPLLAARQVSAEGSHSWIVDAISTIYLNTRRDSKLANLWLGWLAQIGTPAALEAWLDLIREAPPLHRPGIVSAFGPLVNRTDLPLWFFERLLTAALPHVQTAAAALDLINFHVRRGTAASHAGAAQKSRLVALLDQLVDRLHEIEKGHTARDRDHESLAVLVADCVALIVSLCDTLAMIRDETGIPAVRRAMGLRHRRIQTEAAAALARLGEATGRQRLVELAAEPVARQRVLAYAEELDMLELIAEENRSDLALAESQLAVWLAAPQQVGVPPSRLELVEFRELYWPGYDHPVGVYLFRYYYGSAQDATSNLGIVGPLVHAFERDIGSLSLDDALAAFAGWHAVHEDIYEVSLDELNSLQPQLIASRQRVLADHDFNNVHWLFAGCMMGEWILVGTAYLGESSGFIMLDEQRVNWFAADAEQETSAEWAYMVYRGRRILKAFNDQFEAADQ